MMQMSRRDFVRTVAATGAGVALANSGALTARAAETDDINIVMIGCGKQGRVLLQDTLKIPGIRFQAICDIWEYSQKRARGRLRRNNPELKVYTDYREMLEKEKGVDAAIVATPDFMHAEHTIACLDAGLDVYCEKEMSSDLEKAKQMVQVSIKNKLDTVYFLSDGRPSVGKLVDTEEILKDVAKYNDVFKIVIHSIAIGEFQKSFLQRLAQDNGGVFVDLGR